VDAGAREIELAVAHRNSIETAQPQLGSKEIYDAHRPLDPNLVIAAAFAAGGLPVPEIPSRPPGATPHVIPGPIIEAALKAAGLIGA
jgi:hypothetical protein